MQEKCARSGQKDKLPHAALLVRQGIPMTSISRLVAAALMMGTAVPYGFAAPAQRIEAITAQIHAEMAHAADRLTSARAHFHHVINCIVDPDDKRFDARAENPCAGMGSGGGALHDEAATPAQRQQLQHALDIATRGLRSGSLETAHVYAEWLSEVLKRDVQ